MKTEINKRYKIFAWGEWNEATFRKIPHLKVPVFVYSDNTFEFPEMVDEFELIDNENDSAKAD